MRQLSIAKIYAKKFCNLRSVIYGAIIIIILAVVFLSQQPYFRGTSKTFVSAATSQTAKYLSVGSNSITSNIYSKINGGVEAGKNAIQTTQQKISDSENVLQKVGNYFSNIANSIEGKRNIASCQTAAPSSSQAPSN